LPDSFKLLQSIRDKKRHLFYLALWAGRPELKQTSKSKQPTTTKDGTTNSVDINPFDNESVHKLFKALASNEAMMSNLKEIVENHHDVDKIKNSMNEKLDSFHKN
jgi:hypothetical protein